MDNSENRPTLKGEIKKARASNYNLSRAINEFIDNSLDTDANQILVEFRANSEGLSSISISDNSTNGISSKNIKKIFSWTYERDRTIKDIGEFGTGFKSASVNLGEKLVLITWDKIENKYYECIADWRSMSEKDLWVPSLKETSLFHYKKKDNHPFENGSTFIIDQLISTRNNKFEISYIIDIAANYKYILKHYPELSIKIKYLDDIYDLRKFTYYYFDNNICNEEEIGVYTLKKDYILDKSMEYIIGVLSDKDKKYWMKFKGKFKNGNFKLEEVKFDTLSKFYEKKCIITFRSCIDKKLKNDDPKESDSDEYNPAILPSGSVDIIRADRVVGKNITNFIAPRNDGYANYIKHEIWYDDKFLDLNLGITFNKSNDGHIPETNLKYTFNHIIRKHQSKLISKEKIVVKPIDSVKVNNYDTDSDTDSDEEPKLKRVIKQVIESDEESDSDKKLEVKPKPKSPKNKSNKIKETKVSTDESSDENDDEQCDELSDNSENMVLESELDDKIYDKIVNTLIFEIKQNYKEYKIKNMSEIQFIQKVVNKFTNYNYNFLSKL
jgi:hypothetical protein